MHRKGLAVFLDWFESFDHLIAFYIETPGHPEIITPVVINTGHNLNF